MHGGSEGGMHLNGHLPTFKMHPHGTHPAGRSDAKYLTRGLCCSAGHVSAENSCVVWRAGHSIRKMQGPGGGVLKNAQGAAHKRIRLRQLRPAWAV